MSHVIFTPPVGMLNRLPSVPSALPTYFGGLSNHVVSKRNL
jgi:hypothetical protein